MVSLGIFHDSMKGHEKIFLHEQRFIEVDLETSRPSLIEKSPKEEIWIKIEIMTIEDTITNFLRGAKR